MRSFILFFIAACHLWLPVQGEEAVSSPIAIITALPAQFHQDIRRADERPFPWASVASHIVSYLHKSATKSFIKSVAKSEYSVVSSYVTSEFGQTVSTSNATVTASSPSVGSSNGAFLYKTDTAGNTIALVYSDATETATITFLTDTAGDITAVGYADATETATVDFLTDTAGDTTAFEYMDSTLTFDYDPLTDAAGSTTAVEFWNSTAATTTIAESALQAAATSAVSSQTTMASAVSSQSTARVSAGSSDASKATGQAMVLVLISGIWSIVL